jgi:hypothetical protein
MSYPLNINKMIFIKKKKKKKKRKDDFFLYLNPPKSKFLFHSCFLYLPHYPKFNIITNDSPSSSKDKLEIIIRLAIEEEQFNSNGKSRSYRASVQ